MFMFTPSLCFFVFLSVSLRFSLLNASHSAFTLMRKKASPKGCFVFAVRILTVNKRLIAPRYGYRPYCSTPCGHFLKFSHFVIVFLNCHLNFKVLLLSLVFSAPCILLERWNRAIWAASDKLSHATAVRLLVSPDFVVWVISLLSL